MKAITIKQPFASLLVSGQKRYETRSWYPKYRGPMAIHAAAAMPSKVWLEREFPGIFEAAGMSYEEMCNLPRGCVIATANLDRIWDAAHMALHNITLPDSELRLGRWDNSFGWEFKNIKALETPVPAKGQQGLWNWNEEDADA